MTYTCSQPRLYTTILQCLFELCKVSDQVTSVLSQPNHDRETAPRRPQSTAWNDQYDAASANLPDRDDG